MYCSQCGQRAEDNDRFCTACGEPIVDRPVVSAESIQGVAQPVEPATSTRCPQCGLWSPKDWRVCNCGYDYVAQAKAGTLTFFPVAIHKLVVLSICTFSFYQLYWFYQNWKRINDASHEDISPFWRALWGVLWVIPLFRRIREQAVAVGLPMVWRADVLGACYMALVLCERLPEPWTLLWFGAVIPLVPVQQVCQRVNDAAGNPEGRNARYSAVNVLTIVVGSIWFLLVLVGTFLPVEPE
ncbi:MAG: zinc ribbon domain-containing protein [Vicinamibacterales bacterium]